MHVDSLCFNECIGQLVPTSLVIVISDPSKFYSLYVCMYVCMYVCTYLRTKFT